MSDPLVRESVLVTGSKTLCGQPSCHHFACGWHLAAEAAEKIAAERDALLEAVKGEEYLHGCTKADLAETTAERDRLREGGKQLDGVIVRLSEDCDRYRAALETIAAFDPKSPHVAAQVAREALEGPADA